VLLHPLDVLQPQLRLDDLHIAQGVDIALDVDYLGVVEGTHDLEDAVDGTDVREEGVAETSAGGRASGEASDVDAGEEGGDARGGLVDVAKPLEAGVGDGDARLFGVYGSVGEIGGLSEI
jgi:hypothetical protein